MSDYLLCPRVKDVPLKKLIEGTTKTVCSFCGEKVWISPNGVEFKEKTKFPVICVPCMRNWMPEEMPPLTQAIVAGFQALLNVLGKHAQDAMNKSEKAAEARRREISKN